LFQAVYICATRFAQEAIVKSKVSLRLTQIEVNSFFGDFSMGSEISSRIKHCRLALDLTQKQVADATGVTSSAVSRWESGKSDPEPERWPALAEILVVSQAYLAGFTSDPSASPVDPFSQDAALLGALQLDWDLAFRAAKVMLSCPEVAQLKEGQQGKVLKRIYTMGVRDSKMLRIDMAAAIVMSME
jgi:transcriptional regulator with XRE-family HTH domain